MRLFVGVCAVVALAACRTEPNPAFCDEGRPCGQGFTCDPTNTCVAVDAGPDEGCVGGCGGETPYCLFGACVACRDAADCPGTAPVCGEERHTCEPCRQDAECAARGDAALAGICAPDGGCVLDHAVVLVDGEAACTAIEPPFCAIGDAVAFAVEAGKTDVLVIETTAGYGPFEVGVGRVRVFGKGLPTVTGVFGADAVHVTGDDTDVELHRLHITGAGGTGAGVRCENASRCVVHRVTSESNGFGVSMDQTRVAEVTRSTIAGNNAGGIWLNRIGETAKVVNNFVFRNGYGESIVGGIRLDGVPTADLESWTIEANSLLANSSNTGMAAAGVHCNQPVTVRLHALWGHPGTSVSSACALSYSSAETVVDGTGNIGGDPMFMRTVAPEDLHIQMLSPCRNAGPSDLPIRDDIDGDLRDGMPDMGADEYR